MSLFLAFAPSLNRPPFPFAPALPHFQMAAGSVFGYSFSTSSRSPAVAWFTPTSFSSNRPVCGVLLQAASHPCSTLILLVCLPGLPAPRNLGAPRHFKSPRSAFPLLADPSRGFPPDALPPYPSRDLVPLANRSYLRLDIFVRRSVIVLNSPIDNLLFFLIIRFFCRYLSLRRFPVRPSPQPPSLTPCPCGQ